MKKNEKNVREVSEAYKEKNIMISVALLFWMLDGLSSKCHRMYSLSKYIHTLRRKHMRTHTWAGVETELRGAFQGVDEWGLAKLPRGVQISSIHKQHSGPCGEEGWDEESWRRKKKKKKKSSQLVGAEKKGKQGVSAS